MDLFRFEAEIQQKHPNDHFIIISDTHYISYYVIASILGKDKVKDLKGVKSHDNKTCLVIPCRFLHGKYSVSGMQ